MSKSIQIGWYELKEDKEFLNNGFECAAWYEKIFVKSGKYPVYGQYQYHEREHCYTNEIKSNSISCKLEGTITGDNFSSYFCGNLINIHQNEKIGQKSSHYLRPYAFSIAEDILKGNSNFVLLDEFEAKKVYFDYNGERHSTHEIINKTLPELIK